MSINDRGMKKWTTMMLPEHKEMLKDMWSKQDQQKQPLFDEQRLEQFNHRLSVAYTDKRSVQITYDVTGHCGKRVTEQKTGLITNIYPETKRIEVEGVFIELHDVIDIEVMDDTMFIE